MKHIIITGASRGLGKALAVELANKENIITLISRDSKDLEAIRDFVSNKGSKAFLYSLDLFRYNEIDQLMEEIISTIEINSCDSIILINNAGNINPINRFSLIEEEEIEKNLVVNGLAPIILMNNFLTKTNDLNVERRIINISSGVVKNPIYGWSLYSASKSAVHSIIETISKESESNLLKVVSFDPGVMDTNMQQSIRQVSKDQFKDVDIFNKFHKNNVLRNTESVATIINNIYIKHWFAKKTFEKIKEYD